MQFWLLVLIRKTSRVGAGVGGVGAGVGFGVGAKDGLPGGAGDEVFKWQLHECPLGFAIIPPAGVAEPLPAGDPVPHPVFLYMRQRPDVWKL